MPICYVSGVENFSLQAVAKGYGAETSQNAYLVSALTDLPRPQDSGLSYDDARFLKYLSYLCLPPNGTT